MTTEQRTKPKWTWWVMVVLAGLIGIYGVGFAFGGAEAFYEGRDLPLGLDVSIVALSFHAVVGGLALLTGPFQFLERIRTARPKLHRGLGRLHVAAALGTGLSGFFVAGFAEGGLTGRLGFAALGALTTTCGLVGLRLALGRRFDDHRVWMMRSFALLLAAVSLRLQIPALFALLDGDETMVFAVVGWSCWVPNLLVVEWMIRRRPAPVIVV